MVSAFARAGACAALAAASAGTGLADTGGNPLALTIAADENRLSILQDHPGPGPANRITLSVSGNGKGGFGEPWPAELTTPAGPALGGFLPGRVVQTGTGNAVALAVLGDGNLFAIAQTGADNRAEGRIEGVGNTVAVTQTGWGNTAGIVQSGTGNIIVVSQASH